MVARDDQQAPELAQRADGLAKPERRPYLDEQAHRGQKMVGGAHAIIRVEVETSDAEVTAGE